MLLVISLIDRGGNSSITNEDEWRSLGKIILVKSHFFLSQCWVFVRQLLISLKEIAFAR